MRRKFMFQKYNPNTPPLEFPFYPSESNKKGNAYPKSEYKYMDVVAIARGGFSDSTGYSGGGSGGAFIVRKLLSTVGQVSFTYTTGSTSYIGDLSIKIGDVSFTLGMGTKNGGSIPSSSILSGLNKYIDVENGGYYNAARSGGGGGGGGNGGLGANDGWGGDGGSGGSLGNSGSRGTDGESRLTSGVSLTGASGGTGSRVNYNSFQIPDIVYAGSGGSGNGGGRIAYNNDKAYIYGGPGGGGGGIGYHTSGKGGNGPSGAGNDGRDGSDYGAGASGAPYKGSGGIGGNPLFLVIYHNGNI